MNTAPEASNTQTPIQHKKRYSQFYFVMLIISTVSAGLSVLFFPLTLLTLFGEFNLSPPFGWLSIALALFDLAGAAALFLLWFRKNPFGIWALLGSYTASVLGSIAQLFFAEPIVEGGIQQTLKDTPELGHGFAEVTNSLATYGGISFGIVFTIVFAILWWFAYKSQTKHEQKS